MHSLDYAIHHLALRAGRFPWELEEMDPPADKVYRALAIEAADAEGRKKARDRELAAQRRPRRA